MKILYGVPGEGMGHATRSKVIITHLLEQGHQVEVVSSARAYQFLNQAFPGLVHEIKGFHLAYRQAAVSKLGTALLTLKSAPENLHRNYERYRQLLASFSPEAVISDFESFTYFFAKQHGLPLISIDNMQVMSRCTLDIPVPRQERGSYAIARNIVRSKVPRSDYYLISSFFDAPVCKERTSLVPPIIRREILQAVPSVGRHVLVYQTSTSQANLVETLRQLPTEEFRVYGFNKEETHGNVQLKAFSEAGFIRDLASARAVVANGGFSLLSEAVYLRKPICSVPIAGQFEQFVNAAYVEKMGYGRHFDCFSADGLKAFLYDVERFRDRLQAYRQEGNTVLFAEVDRQLAALVPA
ncbi:MJ1255/VC2487 family glycosyltransferase [Pontibacter mangrovi]|uniref:UDP-glucuronosyltransferase n=1 Tax=Pontibacter mangrovi TaxID=2589816 RepID=A0A501VYI5_9BACT|nr:MJ1255/VC2487 family glycosyltransferase [Pontibacter mangrovi]TPE42469.1 UDP-glucuronosyltransferase [Pontibacter mangrovi]